MKHLSQVAVLCVGLTVAVMAVAEPDRPTDGPEQRPSGPRHGQHHDMAFGGFLERFIANPRVAQELDLSDEQMGQLKAANTSLRERQSALQEKLRHAGLQQARLMTDAEIDEDALMDAVEKAGAIRTEMAKLRVRELLTLRRTLSDEQIHKLQALKRRATERMEENGERWREEMKDRSRLRLDRVRKRHDGNDTAAEDTKEAR